MECWCPWSQLCVVLTIVLGPGPWLLPPDSAESWQLCWKWEWSCCRAGDCCCSAAVCIYVDIYTPPCHRHPLTTLPPTLPLVTPSTPSPSFSYQWRMISNVNLIFTKDWFFSKCPKCSFSGWRLKRSHLIYWTTNYVLGNYQNCAMIR